jgi:hypothetical protein
MRCTAIDLCHRRRGCLNVGLQTSGERGDRRELSRVAFHRTDRVFDDRSKRAHLAREPGNESASRRRIGHAVRRRSANRKIATIRSER